MPSTNYRLLTTQSPLVVIVGETASGKSALAMQLAEKFDGEIICADSWTVRREVNIGTAKPSKADQTRIPHHLLDIAGPCEDFTAAVFKRRAGQAINDITARARLPIMVGGTGLYINGVLFDYGFLPPGDRALREQWDDLTVEKLFAIVQQQGLSADGIDVRNKRRLIRLLETGGAKPERQAMRPNTLILGLQVDREELRKRIERRTDNMLEQGLESEVRHLVEVYGWACEALKGIGYQEWREYFDGSQDLATTRARIISGTMNLAKRQRTWFKRNNSIHWISDRSYVVDIVTTFLNKLPK